MPKNLVSFQIIQLFIGAQLTELSINPVIFGPDWRNFINFLSSQTRLEKLRMVCLVEIPDDVELPKKLNCHLKDLVMTVNNFRAVEVPDKFVQFLNLFKKMFYNLTKIYGYVTIL